MQRIDEVSFADLTPLGECLRRHLGKNRFIHFSKTNERVGVNVKQNHKDPPGVYFYPIDWLWNHSDFHEGNQWPTNYPHYVIAELDFARPGLDLSKITDAEIEELGRRNGWFDEYEKYQPRTQLRNGNPQKMWDVLNWMNGNFYDAKRGWGPEEGRPEMSWLKALKGLCWIFDNKGIIHSNEPEQVCVMDPRVMRVVEKGQQDRIEYHDWEKWSYWGRIIARLFGDLAERHGGKVVWKNKRPKYVVSGDNWSFDAEWSDSFAMSGLLLQWRMGRSVEGTRIGARAMRDTEYDTLLSDVEKFVEDCKNFDGVDLKFEGIISPDEAADLLRGMVDDPQSLDLEYEIDNPSKSIRIQTRRVRGKPPTATTMAINVRDDITLSVGIEINGTRIMHASGTPDTINEHFFKGLDVYSKQISSFHPDSPNYKRFTHEEWEPFLGWLFRSTGLKVLEQYDEAFHNYRNLKELYGQIDWIFRRVGW